MKKILIVRIGAIGDVVHTTNLYRAIKLQYPDTIIHYLTSSLIKPLLEADKDIAKIIEVNNKLKLFSNESNELINRLKTENYDLVLNLQPSLKTRLIVTFAGIKKQYNYKKDFNIHAVKNFWQIGLKPFPNIKELNDLKLYLPENIIKKAKNELSKLKHPLIVINAGGMFSKRQGRAYPIDKWLELGNKIYEKYNASILLTGEEADKKFLLPLEQIKNSINYIGKLSLIETCSLISQADLMISGDSGPLHIACALGVKSIGLFGSMPVNRTGCYYNGINIISGKKCVPCNKRKCVYLKKTNEIYAPCMQEIDVDDIIKEIMI